MQSILMDSARRRFAARHGGEDQGHLDKMVKTVEDARTLVGMEIACRRTLQPALSRGPPGWRVPCRDAGPGPCLPISPIIESQSVRCRPANCHRGVIL